MGLFRVDPSELLPTLRGREILLRGPDIADHAEWRALRAASRGFLEPWEPTWGDDDLEAKSFGRRLSHWSGEIRRGTAQPFFLFSRRTGELLGGVTLAQVRRGVAQTGTIGYWMGEVHAGRGHMTEAVALIARHAFDDLALNRLEAACLPENGRSIRLLEKVGFTREGLARNYLRIAGHWRDHLLWGLLAGDPTMPGAVDRERPSVGIAAEALVVDDSGR